MESGGGAPKFGSTGDPERRMMMQLHIVKGSFVTADTGGGGEQCTLNAAVWSRMPEELLWRVVQFVPAVKLFQWQLVSRRWRQTLTSHDFRKQLVATAAAGSGRGAAGGAVEQSSVIAFVFPGCSPATDESNGHNSNVRVVDIELSFVPSWFWKSESYSVLGAMDGLVCISNEKFDHDYDRCPKDNQYCVISPLTRTCKILPKVPFAPSLLWRISRPVTIFCRQVDDGSCPVTNWKMATLDLEGAGDWTLIDNFVLPPGTEELPVPECVAVWEGEFFYYLRSLEWLLFSVADGTSLTTGTLGGPKFDGPVFSNLEGASYAVNSPYTMLVAHRGSVLLIAELEQEEVGAGPAISCGIWKLVRDRLAWEAAAGLVLDELDELYGLSGTESGHLHLRNAWGAVDHLCLMFSLDKMDVGSDSADDSDSEGDLYFMVRSV